MYECLMPQALCIRDKDYRDVCVCVCVCMGQIPKETQCTDSDFTP